MERTVQKTSRMAVLLMLFCAFCLCGGQFVWKYWSGLPAVIVGFGIYGIGALAMLCAYRFGSLSVLQPISSVSYAAAVVLGALIFRETVTIRKILGVAVIMAGVFLLAQGEEQ